MYIFLFAFTQHKEKRKTIWRGTGGKKEEVDSVGISVNKRSSYEILYIYKTINRVHYHIHFCCLSSFPLHSMEIFFNRKEWGKDEMKKDYENQNIQDHSLHTAKNRKSKDQLERQFIAQTCCRGQRINSEKTRNNVKNQSHGGKEDKNQ